MNKQTIYLNKTDKGFYYGYIGSELHGRASFKFWVNRKLIKENENGIYIEFPLANAEIVKTEKGNIVVRPADNKNIFVIGRKCGFRGESWFEIIEPKNVTVFEFEEWDSERGNLGVSQYGLVVTGDYIKAKEEADGRLYGADEVYYKKYSYKNEEFIEEDYVPCDEDNELCKFLN